MAPPRVFISHSCKDAELALPAPADADGLARYTRLAYARLFRTQVTQTLEASGFEVDLDVDRLEPGDEWRAKLHFWLETCDAGVILLNPEAVASKWVRKEVDILMHRWAVSGSFESDRNKRLRIVPVFLGGFGDADIRDAGFGDLEILSVQAARLLDPEMSAANAAQLTAKVVDVLKGLLPTTRDSHLERWLTAVEAGLIAVRTKGEKFLDEARKRAHVGDADWSSAATQVEILAHHLLHSDLPTVKAALIEMRPAFLNPVEYQTFAERLLPLWVDESLARGLVSAKMKVEEDHDTYAAVALNAGQFATVRDYINRAWGFPWWGKRCIDFEPPVGEDAERRYSKRYTRQSGFLPGRGRSRRRSSRITCLALHSS